MEHKNIKRPGSITLRCCPKCSGRATWAVHGFAYPGGDDSNWKCFNCDYKGKPRYKKYTLELKESVDITPINIAELKIKLKEQLEYRKKLTEEITDDLYNLCGYNLIKDAERTNRVFGSKYGRLEQINKSIIILHKLIE